MGSWRFLLGCILGLVALATAIPAPAKIKRDIRNKDKRSQEDIMFGNQQNKPAGMVDDLIVFPDRKSGPPSKAAQSDKQNSTAKGDTHDTTSKPPPSATDEEFRKVDDDGDRPRNSDRFDYYDYLDDADSRENRPSDSVDNGGAIDYSLYDYNEEVLRKKRNLRNSLEELLSNRRLPRRAMRLKRDAANVDNILYLLAALAKADPRLPYELDEELSQIPTNEVPQYYPESEQELMLNLAREELSKMAPKEESNRIPSYPELAANPDEFQDMQGEVPEWFPMVRRSPAPTGFLYPQDYRYIPLPVPQQMKKRNQRSGHWGRIMQRRRQNFREPSDEGDLGRLYALASLLAEPAADDGRGW